jgi:hypothetical protein
LGRFRATLSYRSQPGHNQVRGDRWTHRTQRITNAMGGTYSASVFQALTYLSPKRSSPRRGSLKPALTNPRRNAATQAGNADAETMTRYRVIRYKQDAYRSSSPNSSREHICHQVSTLAYIIHRTLEHSARDRTRFTGMRQTSDDVPESLVAHPRT